MESEKELRIGDIFSFGIKRYRVEPKKSDSSVGCTSECDFRSICLNMSSEKCKELIGSCFDFSRKDNQDIVFVELDN